MRIRMLIGQGPFLDEDHAEWHIWCDQCGAETYVLFRRDEFDE